MVTHGIVDKPFKCDQCDWAFTFKDRLDRHMLGVHAKLKPHSCDICGKSFSHRRDLERHKETHIEKNLCFCEECDKGFKSVRYLNKHLKNVHRKGRDEGSMSREEGDM